MLIAPGSSLSGARPKVKVKDTNGPQEFGTGLSLNINEYDNALDFSLAIEIAQYAGITKDEANETVQHTKEIVSRWRSLASSFHISREEQEMMSVAFIV